MARLLRRLLVLLEACRWPSSAYVSGAWVREQRRAASTRGIDQGSIDWDAMRRREF